MPSQTVLENDHIVMWYHEETQIIHHQYSDSIHGEYLYEGLNLGVELMQEHGCVKWLSDNRAIGPTSDEETEWINTNWLPRAVEAGWKFWALVVPGGMAAQMNMTEFVNAFYDMGVRVQVFTDPDTAMTWLVAQ